MDVKFPEQPSCSYAYNNTIFKCEHWKCLRAVLVTEIPSHMPKKTLKTRFSQYGFLDDVQFLHGTKCVGKCKTREALVIYYYSFDVVKVLNLPDSAVTYSDYSHTGNLFVRSYCYYNLSPSPELPLKKRKAKESAGDMVDESTDFINELLPNEILLKIFAYLLATERIGIDRVCRRWRHINFKGPWIGMSVLRFPEPSKACFKEFRNQHLYAVFHRCGMNLREIDFHHCPKEFSEFFSLEMANSCPNLVSIDFSGLTIIPAMMSLLARYCPLITKLIFCRCNIKQYSVRYLLERLQLKYLDLTSNPNLSISFLHILPKSMETLILDDCRTIMWYHFRLIAKCNNIRDLRLSCCKKICKNDLMHILNAIGKNLVELHLGGTWCNRVMLKEALGYLRNLKRLSLRSNTNINDITVIVVSLECPRLTFFDLTGVPVSNITLNKLKYLRELSDLRLNYNNNITDDGIFELSESKSLQRIDLRSCSSITNEGCRQLILGCPSMTFLDISDITTIDNNIIDSTMQFPTTRKGPLTLVVAGTSITNIVCNIPLIVIPVDKCVVHFQEPK